MAGSFIRLSFLMAESSATVWPCYQHVVRWHRLYLNLSWDMPIVKSVLLNLQMCILWFYSNLLKGWMRVCLLLLSSNRGDKTSVATELNRVLTSQVLLVVWNKQSEVGSSHSIPIQLSRPFVLSRLLREGDFCTDFSGNGYRSFAGDHGGMASEVNHKHKWRWGLWV